MNDHLSHKRIAVERGAPTGTLYSATQSGEFSKAYYWWYYFTPTSISHAPETAG